MLFFQVIFVFKINVGKSKLVLMEIRADWEDFSKIMECKLFSIMLA